MNRNRWQLSAGFSKIIEKDNKSYRKCINCGSLFYFKRLPIIFLTGASGVGKSTIGAELSQIENLSIIPVESDILWNESFNTPEDSYRTYRETWLRLCKNYNLSGKPTFLVGCIVTEQIEHLEERKYFSETIYLALVRSDQEIKESLLARPEFRNTTEQQIKDHISFNNWIKENYDKTTPKIHLIDASNKSIEETTKITFEIVNQLLQNIK